MQTVKKAVILAGGRGTRFLPYTKSVPKEMLAVVDTPVIQLIVEEIAKSGINDILIIINNQKEMLKQYFQDNTELETFLLERGRMDEYAVLQSLKSDIKVSFVVQNEANGTGEAVYLAREFTAGEPFAVLNGDDYIVNKGGDPATGQLCASFKEGVGCVIGVQEVAPEEISKYGSVIIDFSMGRLHKMKGIIEKPKREEAKSFLACFGRYVFCDKIYEYIRKTPVAKNGELCLTDSIHMMAGETECYAYDFEGKRYDMGNKFGSMTANVEFALEHPEIKKKFADYLRNLKV